MNFFQLLAIFMALFPIAISAIETEITTKTNTAAAMTTFYTAVITATAATNTATPITMFQNRYSFDFKFAHTLPKFYLSAQRFLHATSLKLKYARYTLETILTSTRKALTSINTDTFVIPNNSLPCLENAQTQHLSPKTLPAVYIYSPPALSETRVCPANDYETKEFYRNETNMYLWLLFISISLCVVYKSPSLVRSSLRIMRQSSLTFVNNSNNQTKIGTGTGTGTGIEVEIVVSAQKLNFKLSGTTIPSVSNTADNHMNTAGTPSPIIVENTNTESKILSGETIINSNSKSVSTQTESESAGDIIDRDSDIPKRCESRNESCKEFEDASASPSSDIIDSINATTYDNIVIPAQKELTVLKREQRYSNESKKMHNTAGNVVLPKNNEPVPRKTSGPARIIPLRVISSRKSRVVTPHTPLHSIPKNEETSFLWPDMEPFDKIYAQSINVTAQTALLMLMSDIPAIEEEIFCNKFNPPMLHAHAPKTPKPDADESTKSFYISNAQTHIESLKDALTLCNDIFDVMQKGMVAVEHIEKRFVEPRMWNKLDLSRQMERFFNDIKSEKDLDCANLIVDVTKFNCRSSKLIGDQSTCLHRSITLQDHLITRISNYLNNEEAYRVSLLCKALRIIDDYNGIVRTLQRHIDPTKVREYEAKVAAYRKQNKCTGH